MELDLVHQLRCKFLNFFCLGGVSCGGELPIDSCLGFGLIGGGVFFSLSGIDELSADF